MCVDLFLPFSLSSQSNLEQDFLAATATAFMSWGCVEEAGAAERVNLSLKNIDIIDWTPARMPEPSSRGGAIGKTGHTYSTHSDIFHLPSIDDDG